MQITNMEKQTLKAIKYGCKILICMHSIYSKILNISDEPIEAHNHFYWTQVNTEALYILCPSSFITLTTHIESQMQSLYLYAGACVRKDSWVTLRGSIIRGFIFGVLLFLVRFNKQGSYTSLI